MRMRRRRRREVGEAADGCAAVQAAAAVPSPDCLVSSRLGVDENDTRENAAYGVIGKEIDWAGPGRAELGWVWLEPDP
jgi:hypothetical protein